MKFPEYVPAAAQKFFSLEIQVLERLIEKTEPMISNLERLIPRVVGLQKALLLSMHNQSRKEHHHLSDRSNVIRRLAGLDSYDVVMKPAYDSLAKKFRRDGQWLRYFAAAYWSARNYSEYRDRKREAEPLFEQLAEGLRSAKEALTKVRQIKGILPIELREVRARKEPIRFVTRDECFNHLEAKRLMNIEANAPEGPDALEYLSRLSDVAIDSRITFLAHDVDAAISKQKSCPKTEHIRAFAHLLIQRDFVAYGPFLSCESFNYARCTEGISEDAYRSDPEQVDEPIQIDGRKNSVVGAMAITSSVVLDPQAVSERDIRATLRV
jgi:hypothetical protein